MAIILETRPNGKADVQLDDGTILEDVDLAMFERLQNAKQRRQDHKRQPRRTVSRSRKAGKYFQAASVLAVTGYVQ